MIKKPHFAYDQKDQKVGVVLTYKDFEDLMDELQDVYDYELVQKRKKKKEKTYSLEEVSQELFGKSK